MSDMNMNMNMNDQPMFLNPGMNNPTPPPKNSTHHTWLDVGQPGCFQQYTQLLEHDSEGDVSTVS